MEDIWKQYLDSSDDCVDLLSAKRVFFNKENTEIHKAFSLNVIERTDELRFMPPMLFNYYFHFFIEFIMFIEHDDFFKSEIADSFITLLNQKLDESAINDLDLLKRCVAAVDFLGANLDSYNTDVDIYGDLEMRLNHLNFKLRSYRV